MPKGNHSGLGFWGARHSFGGEDHTWKGHLAILPQTGIFDIYNRGWEARCKREGTTDGISGDWLEMGPGTGGNTAVDGESAAEVTPLVSNMPAFFAFLVEKSSTVPQVYSLHGWNQVEILVTHRKIPIFD